MNECDLSALKLNVHCLINGVYNISLLSQDHIH